MLYTHTHLQCKGQSKENLKRKRKDKGGIFLEKKNFLYREFSKLFAKTNRVSAIR